MNEINVIKLNTILQQNSQNEVIIDVRDDEERDEGFIPNSVHIPLEILVSKISHFLNEFKDKKIYFQCRSGRRSKKATTVFLQAGFSDVFSVEGGLQAWQEAGLMMHVKTENKENLQTVLSSL